VELHVHVSVALVIACMSIYELLLLCPASAQRSPMGLPSLQFPTGQFAFVAISASFNGFCGIRNDVMYSSKSGSTYFCTERFSTALKVTCAFFPLLKYFFTLMGRESSQ